jgi:hypothetical protein
VRQDADFQVGGGHPDSVVCHPYAFYTSTVHFYGDFVRPGVYGVVKQFAYNRKRPVDNLAGRYFPYLSFPENVYYPGRFA